MRSYAQRLKANCTNRTLLSPKVDYFDSDGNWRAVVVAASEEVINPVPNSPFMQLLTIACGVMEGQGTATKN